VKLGGTAETYLNTPLEVQEEITYDKLKAIFIERFKEKHPDVWY
jgi:hypothetical protein